MSRLINRLLHLLRRSRHEADLREEMETHRSLRQEKLERDGVAPAEAEHASRRALGNVMLAREDAGRVWITAWISDGWRDARVAVRSFARRPMPWIAAVLSLALGVGVNTAIFSVFDAILLRRLPVPAPEEIVNVVSPGPKPGSRSTTNAGGVEAIFSYPLFRDIERFTETGLSGLAAHGDFRAHLSHNGKATHGGGLLVSGGYFPTLGIRPALGRLFTSADDRTPQDHAVVVLSHRYWTSVLGASPAALDDTLVVNGHALTIVGVAPAGFTGTTMGDAGPDVFVPLAMTAAMRGVDIEDRLNHWIYAFGRLDPGVRREEASARINGPFANLIREVEYPALRAGMGDADREAFQARQIVLEEGAHGQNASRADVRTMLLMLASITGCVLLIACANVANMLLVRATDRAAETAVRLAIGATPGRLLRWLLAESCLLGLAGGAGAILVAWLTVEGMLALTPADSRPFEFALNAGVMLFALGIGFGTGLLFGLFPALQAVAATGLHQRDARTTSGTKAARRLRSALATTEVAMATALLAAAGFFLVSLFNLARAELGIRPDGLAVFGVSPGLAGYSADRSRALVDRLETTLAGLPGVTSVSASTLPILGGWNSRQNLTVEGFEPGPGGNTHANRMAVGEGYFRTLGIQLLAGREITRTDAGPEASVAVVNEAFVRKFGLSAPVIGKRFGFGQGDDVQLSVEIVGVVADTRYSTVREPPPPQFFLSNRQADANASTVFFYVRASTESASLLGPIRVAVEAFDPNLPLTNLRTMDEQIATGTRLDRMLAIVSSAFAVLATILAGIGLYAVVSYVVSRRWREYGIRLALGATAGQIRRSIVADVGRIAAAGVVLGALAAVVLGRIGRTFFVDLSGTEPWIVLAAVGLALLVTFTAALVPVRRAGLVKPVDVLRAE